MTRSVAILVILATAGRAQLVDPSRPVPRRAKPPVVFLNGYQQTCDGVTFAGTFASADRVLERNGQISLFFDNCTAGRVSIEELGNRFGGFLVSLRYDDGQPVSQVDVVAHSLGGLIVRSYLSGKQASEGVFTPPAQIRIRRAVFLATPHFGSTLTQLFPPMEVQTEQVSMGSRFLFDLATWNQGTDDLRGVEALSLLGNAGNSAFGLTNAFTDGVVSLTSGAIPGRTRILGGYCHTTGALVSFVCRTNTGIAQIESDDQPNARAIVSFLNGTQDWQQVGESAESNGFLSTSGALQVRWKDSSDRVMDIQAASALGLDFALRQVAFRELIAAQPLQINLRNTDSTAQENYRVLPGYTQAITIKSGPVITRLLPSAAVVVPLGIAPGSLASIYGSRLAGSAVLINGDPVATQYNDDTQINFIYPQTALGLTKVTVRNAGGEHTVNVLVEPTVPAIFGNTIAAATNALTGTVISDQNPIAPGGYVGLYVTGLGETERRGDLDWAKIQPEVTIGDAACQVLYAGRAPGYPGLDQINCQLASTLSANTRTPVTVLSNGRRSNTAAIPVR
jgi:uncharacterized protein (TIGR03437 family)